MIFGLQALDFGPVWQRFERNVIANSLVNGIVDVSQVIVGQCCGVESRLGFKPSVASEKTLGGFDSHPLPLLFFYHPRFRGFLGSSRGFRRCEPNDIRLVTWRFRPWLHRILQRGAVAFDGSLEMFASCLAVMPIGDRFGMAEPIGGNLGRERVGQFGRSTK